MNLQPLVPMLTIMTLSIVAGLCALDHHHAHVDATDIYKFPAGLGFFMFLGSLFFASVPFWPGARGDMTVSQFGLMFLPFVLFALAGSIYFFKYRVIVDSETITYGAFFKRCIKLSDIASVELIRGNRSSNLKLRLHNGRPVSFSGMLADFSSLSTSLSAYNAKTA